MSSERHIRAGVFFAFGAYVWWGLIPIYFKQVQAADATEIIVHRLVWTLVCMTIIVVLTGRGPNLGAALRNRKTLAALALSGMCIAANWLIFVWAVTHGRVHDTSLGYFINPLLFVFLGLVVLGERLRRMQMLALLLAAAGVAQFMAQVGVFPWIALSLATTFGIYGLIRKQVNVDAFVGLLIETLLVSPLAIGYFAWLAANGANSFGPAQPGFSALLMLAGPVTATPLVMFATGARRINMTTLGFLQYVAPTMTFLLAVLIYGETFSQAKLITFICVWVALAIYSADSVRNARRA